METQPSLFHGQSLRALLFGWAAVFGPLLLCFLVQVPEIAKIQTPDGPLTGSYLKSGLLAGLGGSIALVLVFVMPPLYRLRATNRTRLADYSCIPAVWLGFIALLLGLAAMVFVIVSGSGQWWQSLLSTGFGTFVLLLIPVMLACLTYWFMAIRTDGGMRAITAFSVLFVLWVIICFLVAGNWAALMAA